MRSFSPIPTLYHRRLVLIAGGMCLVLLLLVARLGRLSVVKGSELRARAERTLHQETILPTYRGRILDRTGRTLARDEPGYAIAVQYDFITGAWETTHARRQARREIGPGRWAAMSEAARAEAARRRLPAWRARSERVWQAIRLHGGIDEAELAARRAKIHRDVEALAGRVHARQRRREQARDGGKGPAFRPRPIREQTIAHPILPAVSDEVAFTFRTLAGELPPVVEVQDARRRTYPWRTMEIEVDRRGLPAPLASTTPITVHVDGVADHLVGSMRPARAEDVAGRPFRMRGRGGEIDLGGYQGVGDRAGAGGIERAFEPLLRGRRGRIRRRLDSGAEDRQEPEPGRDVTLTIDIELQARIQALFAEEIGLAAVQKFHHNEHLPVGWPLNGAAVVIEIESGEILAMVSVPTRAAGGRLRQAAVDQPWINRPVEAVYPPGSIIKPLILLAAVSDGVLGLDERIECTGHFFPNVLDRARCWIYRPRWHFATHGALTAEQAIARSCNIFFYTLADRLGAETITAWYRRFGLGRPLEVGLRYPAVDAKTRAVTWRGESGGTLFSSTDLQSMPSADRRFDTIMMGIGQGPGVTWTPVQAANAYATFARGGVVRDAKVVLEPTVAKRRPQREDLPLAPAAVAATLRGLRGAVSPGGTGDHITFESGQREAIFRAPGVTVWGKTGTAQAPPLRTLDTNGDGAIDGRDEGRSGLDHAWFVGLAGPDDTGRPMFAIAVVVEYGGSGGRVAAPIANQIIAALQAEGYLPGAAFTRTAQGR